jgi:two-component system, chemotaxis family, chemotaxis protein CheY
MSESSPLSSLRVLLVEDDPAIAKLLQLMLMSMDVTLVHAANDGVQALKYLGENEGAVNTLLCDWNMPHMTGTALLRQVRTVDPMMRFIMVTGRATLDLVHEARGLGVAAFITKPFYAETIREKLELVAAELTALEAR